MFLPIIVPLLGSHFLAPNDDHVALVDTKGLAFRHFLLTRLKRGRSFGLFQKWNAETL